MEGDFNMHNRLIFGTQIMEIAREADLIPPEQFAEKQSDGQDGVFLARYPVKLGSSLRSSLQTPQIVMTESPMLSRPWCFRLLECGLQPLLLRCVLFNK
jgi:hypothetical protein